MTSIRYDSIEVDDPFVALRALTRHVRQRVPRRLVGVTGSAGKTTTKELLAGMLARRFRTAASPGNLNNLYGFPLALLGVDDATEWMVAEMGMSEPGELGRISELARPDAVVLINVRPVHLEFFGTLDRIAEAKAEIFAGLQPGGLVIANADDPQVVRVARRRSASAGVEAAWYSLAGAAPPGEGELSLRVRELECPVAGQPGSRFLLEAEGPAVRVRLPLVGRHNVENFLAAATAAYRFGVPLEAIAEAAAAIAPAAMRGVLRSAGAAQVYDDSYNSNPDAVARALEAVGQLPAKRRWVVLGDMLELGPEAARFHREAGQRAARLGFDPVVGVGELALEIVAGAAAEGVATAWFATAAEAARFASDEIRSGDLLLVKGSRGVGLEVVVDHVLERALKAMLYDLLYPLQDSVPAFNVFRYITFRSAGAALTALVLCLMLGPWAIRTLRRLSIGQSIREEGPQSHQGKAGTPTMGGLLILVAVLVPTLLWARLDNAYVWVAAGSMLAFGAIGFADDYLKVVRRKNKGLSVKGKFALQCVVALGVAWALMRLSIEPSLSFPFFKNLVLDLGPFYPLLVVVVLVGCSNAVNLTDGLDGLAIGATLIVAATYAIFTYIAGHRVVAEYLQVPSVPGVGEVAVFCTALVGASLGFLWWNSHPAEVFMGDVGSLAIGGAIGTVALLAKQEAILVLVGGLFVLEALSVIVQVGSFKLRGKRVFRMAPLHHHFELAGWKEPQIIVRFWILAILFALLSLSTLKLR